MFCKRHLAAPPGQRGGWMSAHRRAANRGNHAALDASNVARRLWVGGSPPLDRDLPDFDLLVLCAAEIQPERMAFAGSVIRCPLPDSHLTGYEAKLARSRARQVGQALASGKRVLVTCQMGWNRSALVASLALGFVTRMAPADLVTLMRSRRGPSALSNPYFVRMIETVVALEHERRRRHGV